MKTRPIHQVCPLCGHDDGEFLAWEPEGPGQWRYVCHDPAHPEAFTWLTTGVDKVDEAGNEGLSNELGIYEDLLACFGVDEPMLEYGIVEYRYAHRNQVAYRHLVQLYSHTRLGATRYSASAFIGAAVGKLGREGLLRRIDIRATGYWKYNGMLNAWALTDAPSDEVLTWEAFAIEQNLDPLDWPTSLLA